MGEEKGKEGEGMEEGKEMRRKGEGKGEERSRREGEEEKGKKPHPASLCSSRLPCSILIDAMKDLTFISS